MTRGGLLWEPTYTPLISPLYLPYISPISLLGGDARWLALGARRVERPAVTPEAADVREARKLRARPRVRVTGKGKG